MNYWLMKSEPSVYSIDDLQRDKKWYWDGVRNYQVRNMLRDQMKIGDLAFFYHSNANPTGIAGMIEIASEAYPDHTAFDPKHRYYDPKSDPNNPRWWMVDVKFKQKFSHVMTLAELREHPQLKDLLILRKGNRLSITPLTKVEWQTILKIESAFT